MSDSNGSSPSPSRALRVMVEELRAEAPPELKWAEVERKLMLEVIKSDEARAAREAAAPRSAFLQTFAFAAAAALIALGVSTSGGGSGPIAAAPIEPIQVDVAQIQAAPGEPGALDLARLEAGDVVVTKDAPLTFRRAGVVAFTMAPMSRITVRSAGDARGVGTTVELEQGALHAEVTPRPASEGLVEAFAVEVARTRVAVHGTAFSVGRNEAGVLVDVEHGTVAVGPTGHVGVTTGHILVGPSRATFSLDGGRSAHFLTREPAKPAQITAAAVGIAAAGRPMAMAAVDAQIAPSQEIAPTAPAVSGAHAASPAHIAAAAIEAPAQAPVDGVAASLPVAAAAPAVLSEAVIAARLRQCFARPNESGSGEAVAVSVSSTLHLSLQADGSVRSAIFNPPLKPEFMDCAGRAISGKFAEGNRQIDLPVSFHAR
jgi:FecR protein